MIIVFNYTVAINVGIDDWWSCMMQGTTFIHDVACGNEGSQKWRAAVCGILSFLAERRHLLRVSHPYLASSS
jgi:hypothetical protein